ncbi:unnamed protein product [Somion occarium]|uniref:BHLH domain-containing protein n=1 Tax=Somion occarium TaxID=3059160 RepID=A0ABP1CIQ3_9APHY
MGDPLQPPVPFDDFTFSFDPALHNLFPSPPPLPSSADLFSPSETTDLLGFLENFSWDVEAETQDRPQSGTPQVAPSNSSNNAQPSTSSNQSPMNVPNSPQLAVVASSGGTPSVSETSPTPPPAQPISSAQRPKPLLSTPQKRLNHIMSEQKRRNAIRDGYVQLTTLLAPAGAPPGTGMPTRGRPKGSSSRNGGRGDGKGGVAFKGKSGILFRAVEYVKWLEESRDALLAEVAKVETAAGIHRS